MTWAAILAIGGRIDEGGARRRLELAMKDEVAFWRRLEECHGRFVPLFAERIKSHYQRRFERPPPATGNGRNPPWATLPRTSDDGRSASDRSRSK
jgi:hypothetical protein